MRILFFLSLIYSGIAAAIPKGLLETIGNHPLEIDVLLGRDYNKDDLFELISGKYKGLDYLSHCSSRITEVDYAAIIRALDQYNRKVPGFLFTCPNFYPVYEQTTTHLARIKKLAAKGQKARLQSLDLTNPIERSGLISEVIKDPLRFLVLPEKSQKELIDFGLVYIVAPEMYSFPIEFFNSLIKKEIISLTSRGISVSYPPELGGEIEFSIQIEEARRSYGKKFNLTPINTPEMSIALSKANNVEEAQSILKGTNHLYFNSTLFSAIVQNYKLRDNFWSLIPDSYLMSVYEYEIISMQGRLNFSEIPEKLQVNTKFLSAYLSHQTVYNIRTPIKYENVAIVFLENGHGDTRSYTHQMLCRPKVLNAVYDFYSRERNGASNLLREIPWNCHNKEKIISIIKSSPDLLHQLKIPKNIVTKHFDNYGYCSFSDLILNSVGKEVSASGGTSFFTTKDDCISRAAELSVSLDGKSINTKECTILDFFSEPFILSGSRLSFRSHLGRSISQNIESKSCAASILAELRSKTKDTIDQYKNKGLSPCLLIVNSSSSNMGMYTEYFRAQSPVTKEECLNYKISDLSKLIRLPSNYISFNSVPVVHYRDLKDLCSEENKKKSNVTRSWGFNGESQVEKGPDALCD